MLMADEKTKAQAAALTEGAKAPLFSLPADSGEDISLADYAGRWVVLYFYPRDSTPGCTRQAQAFRDNLGAFAERDAQILGVSRDTIASHCKFRDNHELNFPLLSDREIQVHEAYGAFGEKNMYGKKVMGTIRTTVIIDPAGKVARIFRNVRVNGHAEAVLAALDELRAS